MPHEKQNLKHNFRITYCVTCGFKPRALKLQSDLEKTFSQTPELVQASGGLFEVEDGEMLLFSKQKEDRFPEENEVINIVTALELGKTLSEAQEYAKTCIEKPPTFEEWFTKKLGAKKSEK